MILSCFCLKQGTLCFALYLRIVCVLHLCVICPHKKQRIWSGSKMITQAYLILWFETGWGFSRKAPCTPGKNLSEYLPRLLYNLSSYMATWDFFRIFLCFSMVCICDYHDPWQHCISVAGCRVIDGWWCACLLYLYYNSTGKWGTSGLGSQVISMFKASQTGQQKIW